MNTEISYIEWNSATQQVINTFKTEVTRKLDSSEMVTRLLNDFMASQTFDDMFKKELTVPIFDINEGILEMAPLDFEYADGAKV